MGKMRNMKNIRVKPLTFHKNLINAGILAGITARER